MDARGNGGATGYLNGATPGFNGPVGVQTPRQVTPFNGVNTSALLASQGTTAQQLSLQQQLRNLDLHRQQLLQYQQRTASGNVPNVANLQQQFAARPQSHLQMGQDQLLSQRLQQQAAQAALARGRTSPQHFLGRTSGGMVTPNQLGNLSARTASNASGSSIDSIVRLLSSQQNANGLNAVGSQAPSSHIQSLLGRRTTNAPGVNVQAQLLQTLAAAQNNPVLTNALQNNLSNLNNLKGIARPANQVPQVAPNAQNATTAGKQALLQQVLAAVQAQCSQNSGQGGRVLPGGAGQIGSAQSAQELLVQLGVCFARLGISVDAAIKAGLLGGLGAQDIRLLADAHANENRKLNPAVELSSQLSGLGLSSVGSVNSELGGGGGAGVGAGGVINPQGLNGNGLGGNRNAPKLSVMQMAASMDLDGVAKADDGSLGGMQMINSGDLSQLLRQSNFGAAEYQEGGSKDQSAAEGVMSKESEGEIAIRAQSEVLLADAKFDSNAYAFFGAMNGDGEELGGLEDDAPLEDNQQTTINAEGGINDQMDQTQLVAGVEQVLPEAATGNFSEMTPRNEDKVIQFGPKPSLLLVAETAKVENKEEKSEKDETEATASTDSATGDINKKASHTITDEDLYERFQDIGIGFE